MTAKLSPEAIEKFGQLFKEFKKAPTQKLKKEMINIFIPQIERTAKKAAAQSGGRISAVDYEQDLYLKFLERLETVDKEEKELYKKFSHSILVSKPTRSARIACGYSDIAEITPLDEFSKASYRIDEQSALQKAEEIVNTANLLKKQKDILKLSLDGYTFCEIGEIFDVSAERVRQIYTESVRRVKEISNQPAIRAIYFDDLHIGRMSTELTDINFEKIQAIERARELEKLKLAAKDKLYTVIKKQSNTIVKEQLPYCSLTSSFAPLSGLKTISHIKKVLRENPNFTIKIRLTEEYKTPDFMKGAELLSIETYGKNIFEFV